MSHTTNENEGGILSMDQSDSPLIGENNYEESAIGGAILKKGPWTSAEDAILVDYVKNHGEGNWNAVQKNSGLSRCGKSCRLRWANHLRPNLKKGTFTAEEEQLIIELHAKMGNKWARMAAHLPGRTDNEIKNYWNTRIKRRQRAGLPLYPPEVCLQVLQENEQNQNACAVYGDKGHHDLFQTSGLEIPDVIFDGLRTNQGILPYVSELRDISASSMLMKGLDSQFYSFITPTTHCQKHHRESVVPLLGFSGGVGNEPPFFGRTQDDGCENKITRFFDSSFPYDPDPISENLSPFCVNQSSHSPLNGHFSTSKPTNKAVKLELPSLQYSESDLGSWVTPPPAPLLESVDAFIQSPSPSVPLQLECHSPRNSGLLDALLHEAKNLSNVKYQSSAKSSNCSTLTHGDVADVAAANVSSAEWEDHSGPISPLGNSTASIFSECTPISATGSSLEENTPVEPFPGCNIKSEPADEDWNLDAEKKTSVQLDLSRPDALLGSCWLEQSVVCAKEQGATTDGIAALLGEDLGSDLKNIPAGNSIPSQGWGFGSCTWNNMPAVCQMSELP